MVHKVMETKIAEALNMAEKHGFYHLRRCQDIALILREHDPKFNSYRFSKKCGFNFDVLSGIG